MRTGDYNPAKFALNFSFVRLLLQVILLETSWLVVSDTFVIRIRIFYNIRSNDAKFLSINCYLSVSLSLSVVSSRCCMK